MARALVRWLFGLLVTACCAVVLLGVIERANGRGDAAETAAERLTVAVDAGHGGFDGGAVGVTGVVEAGLSLAVAQEVDNPRAGGAFIAYPPGLDRPLQSLRIGVGADWQGGTDQLHEAHQRHRGVGSRHFDGLNS